MAAEFRLRQVNLSTDPIIALSWYQDPEVIRYSEGPGVKPYNLETVRAMFEYLQSIGKSYMIEVFEGGNWIPIGDVTLSEHTIPIVIGSRTYQSRGIGTRVIKELIEVAKKEGWRQLNVKQVFDYNERSQRMFKGLGFRITGEGVDENGNTYKSYALEL